MRPRTYRKNIPARFFPRYYYQPIPVGRLATAEALEVLAFEDSGLRDGALEGLAPLAPGRARRVRTEMAQLEAATIAALKGNRR